MTSDEKFEKLAQWLRAEGVTVSEKIKVITKNDSYRAVFATGDIKKGEIIGHIPLEKVLTPFHPKVAEICKELPYTNLLSDQPSQAAMSFFFIVDKKQPNPIFKLYYDTLPDYDTFNYLQYKSKEVIDAIKGSELYREYLPRMSNFERNYNTIKENLDKHNITKEEFKEAYFFNYSRAYDVVYENNDFLNFLIPFFDIINDGGKYKNADYLYRADCNAYEYVATRDIKEGDEIRDDYGIFPVYEYTNIAILLDHAYILPENVRKIKIDFDFNGKTFKFDGYHPDKQGCETLISTIEKELKMNKDDIVCKLKEILKCRIEMYENILKNQALKNEHDILAVINEEKSICQGYYNSLN